MSFRLMAANQRCVGKATNLRIPGDIAGDDERLLDMPKRGQSSLHASSSQHKRPLAGPSSARQASVDRRKLIRGFTPVVGTFRSFVEGTGNLSES
jgi:hypothetical protein